MCKLKFKEKLKNFMSKSSNFWDGVLVFLAILGGAFLVNEMFKEVPLYKCSNCGYQRLKWGMSNCPNCKINIRWGKKKK